MPSQKSLLHTLHAGVSGRQHTCRQSKTHVLPKGAPMLVLKEDRSEHHYCIACGLKFIATARRTLDSLESSLGAAT